MMFERLPAPTARELLAEAGRRVIGDHLNVPQADPEERVAEVVRRLNSPSAAVQLSVDSDRLVLSSCSCPLASVTAAHENLCDAVAALLGEAIGVPVRQTCIPGDRRRRS
jgi:predicted ArsR family transcriptional regulator